MATTQIPELMAAGQEVPKCTRLRPSDGKRCKSESSAGAEKMSGYLARVIEEWRHGYK